MLKALLPAIMKLFAYLLVLHLGIDSLLLPPRREYSVSRLEGTRECNLHMGGGAYIRRFMVCMVFMIFSV